MTQKIGAAVIIAQEEDGECTMCGKMDELRPAGVNGAKVCFDCAQKNPEALKEYSIRLFGRAQ